MHHTYMVHNIVHIFRIFFILCSNELADFRNSQFLHEHENVKMKQISHPFEDRT